MSRTQQDQFIDDDEEETCPLCVEELDLSDRGFRPCPCGYQVCQFCYHNVRNNMNGLCPACRRPYEDANIKFQKPTPEEEATWRAKQANRQKKTVAAAQKEAMKREADTLSRKHLAGLRVVQKNLVYVTGLNPSIQEDKLLETLRGQQYFGQYGKIVKIVVSKAKDTSHPQSVGVYVTYARKEDAASCIEAVDGSQNGERVLRAQFGTTKYCSAYLRNEQCGNRNCMFLHEPGEDRDSFTRQDLSSMNVVSTQQPAQTASPSSQPPPQTQQPVAAAHQATRQEVYTTPQSPVDADAPGLPSTASWASKAPAAQRSRAPSRTASAVSATPPPVPALPADTFTANSPSASQPEVAQPEPTNVQTTVPAPQVQKPSPSPFSLLVKTFNNADLKFTFSAASLSQEDLEVVRNYPALFDVNGGAKRRALRQREEEERRRMEAEEQLALQTISAVETDENLERSGSLQLGGEPEDAINGPGQQRVISPPSQGLGNLGLDPGSSLEGDMSNLSLASRGLTPQQQQQLLLQQFRTPSAQGSSFSAPFAGNLNAPSNPPGHARNVSRYTFANDTSSASAAVKPVANSKLMNQQSSMMPTQGTSGFGSNPQQQPFYTSTVSGPPPGLKTTGTPPVSGGGMFGQGHGFATSGLGYGASLTGRSSNDEMMRELLRRRDNGGGQGSDAGKREYMSPPYSHPPSSSSPAAAPGLLNFPFHSQSPAFSDAGSQKPKKKGKKHRHANTSSSGGGVVDVADPSILRARLHQSGDSQGQGLYAGQSQGGLHSMMYGGNGFNRW